MPDVEIPIRKIKKMLDVGQDRIYDAISHFHIGTAIYHIPGVKEQISSGAVQIIESLTLGNATTSAKQVRRELLSRCEVRLGRIKINKLGHF
jgi:hypothetical protein